MLCRRNQVILRWPLESFMAGQSNWSSATIGLQPVWALNTGIVSNDLTHSFT